MLAFNTEVFGDAAFVNLSGGLDIETHKTFKKKVRELVDGGKVRLLFCMANVSSLDSSGVGALLAMRKTALEYGGDVRLVGEIHPKSREVLRLCGLIPVFQRFDSVEKAIESFQSGGG